MSNKVLYGYTGLFNTPDEIINAAKKVSSKGYKKFDVNTPYPVHGMDGAMKLPPSKLGYVALALGLSGAAFGFLFITWIMTIVYPNIIGGKPFYSFPAFIPVTFEITVLAASVGTVVALIVFLFRFPNNSHPLHDTLYMKSVSSDKYGICIEAEDELFDEKEVIDLFTSLGANNVEAVYFEEDETKNINIFDKRFLAISLLVVILTAGGTYFSLNKLMFMTPFNWMMKQEKLNPQSQSSMFADGFGMRTPVEGTVARNTFYLNIQDSAEIYEKELQNPLVASKENLELGKKKYDIYCSPCHGYHGAGDARLNEKFPNPPSIHSDKARTWTDGRIFYVIEKGQNIMPSYSKQLNNDEKWAVVLYIRALQRSLNAKESDLNE